MSYQEIIHWMFIEFLKMECKYQRAQDELDYLRKQLTSVEITRAQRVEALAQNYKHKDTKKPSQ